MNYFGSIFAMVVCIAMSAYFSATETAFSSLNKTRLKVLADNGNKRAALALKLSEDYDKLISTILIGNNIVISWWRPSAHFCSSDFTATSAQRFLRSS